MIMKIKKFAFALDLFAKHSVTFSNKKNLVFSVDNSRGKSTFLRALLYAMGFAVPSTKGVDFGKMQFFLEVDMGCKQVVTVWRGKGDDNGYVFIKDNEQVSKCLFGDHFQEVQNALFGRMPNLVKSNILGAFYVDQEKGWTMLNRGKIIGSISFNIESFLVGLNGDSLDSLHREYASCEREKERYKILQSLVALQNEVSTCVGGVPMANNEKEYLDTELHKLQSEKLYYEAEYRKLDEVYKDNTRLIELIEKLNISIRIEDGRIIQVTKDNIEGYKEVSLHIATRRKVLKSKIKSLNDKIDDINREIDDNDGLLRTQSVLSYYIDEIKNIGISQLDVQSAIEKLSDRMKNIEAEINDKSKNEWTCKISNYIYMFLEKMKVRNNYKKSEPIVLTNKLAEHSGAEMSKRVLAFKFAYVKAVSERYDINLPLIIDSPYSKELDPKNMEEILKILEDEFSEHQIIIASIHDEQYSPDVKIVITGGILDGSVEQIQQ